MKKCVAQDCKSRSLRVVQESKSRSVCNYKSSKWPAVFTICSPPLASTSDFLLQAAVSSWNHNGLPHHLLCSSCKLHRPLASTSHFLVQVPSCLLKARRTSCSKQVPSSSCKHVGLPVPSSVLLLVGNHYDDGFRSYGSGLHWRRAHQRTTHAPPQLISNVKVGCYSNKDFTGGMPIKEMLVPPPKTSNDKFIEKLQATMHRNTNLLPTPPPSRFRKYAGFGWKEHATGVRGATLYTAATPWRSDSRMSWVSG